MRTTYKSLKDGAKQLAELTGKPYKVVPFPGGPRDGYNLVLDYAETNEPQKGYNTVRSGLEARVMEEYIMGFLDGLRFVKDTEQLAVA